VRTYDGFFIIKETVPEEKVKDVIARIKGEIEKAGGRIIETRDLGRRTFARTMQKTDSGFYVALTLQMDATKVGGLTGRYQLDEDIFRFQISRLDDKLAKPLAPAPAVP
jgi:ribosomal protein S6